MGFNLLRKHIKIEPARWYYHCDRLGMLVWQDMVSGGGPYRPMVIQVLPFLGVKLRDSHYRRFGRGDPASRAEAIRTRDATVEALDNFPCIVVWVPFNEGWGQFDAAEAARELHRLDPTRVVDHASGWHDQGGDDLASLHIYFRRLTAGRTPPGGRWCSRSSAATAARCRATPCRSGCSATGGMVPRRFIAAITA